MRESERERGFRRERDIYKELIYVTTKGSLYD
jgi:hypothetical protein